MIVELYGSPGCGKTYLVHKLTGQDNTVAMSDSKIKRVLINAAKKLSMLTPESIKLKNNLRQAVNEGPRKNIYIDRSVDYFINNIVLLSFGYRHINKDMLMAEGLVHRVVSMAVNFGWNEDIVDRVLEVLTEPLQNVKPVYLKVNADICFKSAKLRNRHESEMDELSDVMLRKYIKDFEILFDHVTNKNNYTIITREDYSAIEEIMK